MTLLPIIYTSLLIFAAVTLSIILFSYIAFKTKGNRLDPASKYKNELAVKPQFIVQKNVQPANDFVRKQVPRTNYVFGGQPSLSTKITHVEPPPVRVKPRYTTEFKKTIEEDNNNNKYNEEIEIKNRFRNSGKVRTTRLEIMNESKKFYESNKQDKIKEAPNNYEGLSDLNLFKFYEDHGEKDFNFLTTTGVKRTA